MAPAEAKGVPVKKIGAASRGRAGKGSRRRSRELALQALYQWLVGGHEADDLCREAAAGPELQRVDKAYFETSCAESSSARPSSTPVSSLSSTGRPGR
jgi:transcription termination factor NusB